LYVKTIEDVKVKLIHLLSNQLNSYYPTLVDVSYHPWRDPLANFTILSDVHSNESKLWFYLDEQTTFSLIAYKIPVFIFLLDIFLGFHTGYYELGRVVLSRKSIAKCYLKKKFWVDSFCTLMMCLNTFVIYSSYLNLFNLVLRINQVKKLLDLHNFFY